MHCITALLLEVGQLCFCHMTPTNFELFQSTIEICGNVHSLILLSQPCYSAVVVITWLSVSLSFNTLALPGSHGRLLTASSKAYQPPAGFSVAGQLSASWFAGVFQRTSQST